MRRFFQRIREKAADSSRAPVLISAMGDSVTQGVAEHLVLDSRRVYHRLVQERLEDFFPTTTFSTLNAGVSGDSASGALGRLERDVLRHQPDLVFLAFGLNDCLVGAKGQTVFARNLRQLVSRVRCETTADIILLTPPFMARRLNPRIRPEHLSLAPAIFAAQNEDILRSYAQTIRDVAAELSCPLADVFAEWERLAETGLDTDLWLSNGLNHPDPRGHRLAAEVIFQAILAKANQRPPR